MMFTLYGNAIQIIECSVRIMKLYRNSLCTKYWNIIDKISMLKQITKEITFLNNNQRFKNCPTNFSRAFHPLVRKREGRKEGK